MLPQHCLALDPQLALRLPSSLPPLARGRSHIKLHQTMINQGDRGLIILIFQAHDFHHLKFNQCYGVLGVLDYLHGTDQQFRLGQFVNILSKSPKSAFDMFRYD